MRAAALLCAVVLSWLAAFTAARAGDEDEAGPAATAAPGVVTEGSGDVSVGGQAASRQGDATDQGRAIVTGSTNVYINGKPAVTVGDRTSCGGVVVGGASNVLVNGKPVARAGDIATACPGQ